MLLRLIRYFAGYVKIKVCGDFCERFINICTTRLIAVWDIQKIDENTVCLCMSKDDFKKIRQIAKKTDVRVSIVKKVGLWRVVKKHKKRKLFFWGIGICAAFVIIMSQFIWKIEVVGLTYTDKNHFMQTLKEEGIYIGAPKNKIDQLAFKNNVLLKESELSWVWVDIKGTKAIVSTSQLRKAPVVTDYSVPHDIIAEKDGVISSVVATSGTAKVKEGDSVLAGQLLISSVVTSEYIEPRYTRASGEVFARTWYTEEDNFRLEISPLVETGNKKTYTTLTVFGFDINMFFKKNHKFESFVEEKSEENLSVLGRDIGISLKRETFKQTAPEKKTLSEEEMLKYAEEELYSKIKEKLLEESREEARKVSYIKNEDDTYTVTLTMEFTEQIGKEVPVLNPIYEDGKKLENN